MKKVTISILLIGLLIAVFIRSCQIQQISQSRTNKITIPLSEPASLMTLATESDTENLSIPPTNLSETQCAYIWASQSLPEETQRIEQLLNQAEFENVRVVAEAFGENCVTAEGQNVRFAAMQTDIRLFVTVKSLSNPRELGDLAGSLLKTIFEMPSTALPGMQPGYIGIQFTSDQKEVLNLWFKRELAEQLLHSGIWGEELLRELQRK